MGSKSKKRRLDATKESHENEEPAKRRRRLNPEQLDLSQILKNLADESNEVRHEAAKQLIISFRVENQPTVKDVDRALDRLIQGLCSQRAGARPGFSIALTELLRVIFSSNEKAQGLDLNVSSLFEKIEQKTKVEGNVPGKARRDHLFGRLFAYQVVMQSSMLLEPTISMEYWHQLLGRICTLARDASWLREHCGKVLFDAVKSLKGLPHHQQRAGAIIECLVKYKLVFTPEGVAIWLAIDEDYGKAVPEGIWHDKDPLSKKERSRLAKVMKETYQTKSSTDDEQDALPSHASSGPPFAWSLILAEVLRRDEDRRTKGKEHLKFAQFWNDVVDNNLLSSTTSHERKLWGLKILDNMMQGAPKWTVPALLSPNLLRTLINQSKNEDRYLHNAALFALKSIQARAQRESVSALPIFLAFTSKDISIESNRHAITRFLEQVLLSADDESLGQIVDHLQSLLLRPGSDDQGVAESRRQVAADLFLNTVKHYEHYEKFGANGIQSDHWLWKILQILVEYAYFLPEHNVKTSNMPLPLISERSRTVFHERLSSCLTKLLDLSQGVRIVETIMAMLTTRDVQDLAFKADSSIKNKIENARRSIKELSSQSGVEGLQLLYSLTLLQACKGEEDAILMLDDLDVAREAVLRTESNESRNKDVLIEIVLSFLGNPRRLFSRIGEEAFTAFASQISFEGLRSLVTILDTGENLEGQQELFNDQNEVIGTSSDQESDDDSDNGDASDVEMLGTPGETLLKEDLEATSDRSSDTSSDSSDDGEDDTELTEFNKLLASTLKTSLPNGNTEESSSESDMDDDQMMALDSQLTKIFQQRAKTTNTKQQRQHAKQNMMQFKSRVLDLFNIYMTKEYSNPLVLETLTPMLRCTRAQASEHISKKADKILKNFFNTKNKHKAPLPTPDDTGAVLDILRSIHEEAKMGGGSKLHASLCSTASLYVAKVLFKLDGGHYEKIQAVYARTQCEWMGDGKSMLQPGLFSQFLNWSLEMRRNVVGM